MTRLKATMHFNKLLVPFLGLCVWSCFPSNDSLRAKLEGRAKFDMNCPEIQLAPLEETTGAYGKTYTTTYGVVGCGKRTTYVLNSATMSWVLNAKDMGPAAGVAQPATAAPPPQP